MCTYQKIKIALNIMTMVAIVISAAALFFNAKAFNLQKKSLQATLFKEVSTRIQELEDQWPSIEKEDPDAVKGWYERLFNAFDYFAFFANHGYLQDKQMKFYYKSGIEVMCRRLEEYHPDLLKRFRDAPKEQFAEIRTYYRDVMEKEPSF